MRAYNGKEALELMNTDNIDLVITDVMMPVMSGMELTQHLRSNPLWSNIPIIMLTAKRGEEARAEAYTAGADAYITKPFSIGVLKARIDNLLLRKQQIAHAIKVSGLAGLGQLHLTSEDEAFVQRCVECVQRHLGDSTFDQQAFADEVNMSKSTLYKRLKSLTGMYTSAFIRHVRMRAACQLLEAQPHIRIAELAYAVGYNEPKYFSSCFKKDFGMLPSEYAEKQADKSLLQT
jgi:YesN/AraC family two-component response regulator